MAEVLLGQKGQLWAALADHLLLEVRRALHDRPGEVRLAVPWLVDAALYAHKIRRFDFTLGERDLGPVTLPVLIERYLEIGGRVDLLVCSSSAAIASPLPYWSDQTVGRLVARFPRLACRVVAHLDALLVVAPRFCLVASAAALHAGDAAEVGSGDVGVLDGGPDLRRQCAHSYDTLWRSAIIWTERRDGEHAR